MEVKSSHRGAYHQPHQCFIQRPLRAQSHYSQSVRIPFVTNSTVQPECLIPNQRINLGQSIKQVPVVYSKNSCSVTRNPSIGRQQNPIVTVMPNSMKVIPANEIKQQLVHPPPNIKRSIEQSLQIDHAPISPSEIIASTPIRRLDDLLDDPDQQFEAQTSDINGNHHTSSQKRIPIAWECVRPNAFRR
jgi:hypothetical protein